VIDELWPLIMPMLEDPKRSSQEKRIAICIFDDIVEHAGEVPHTPSHTMPSHTHHVHCP
jgi:hypothetical protein